MSSPPKLMPSTCGFLDHGWYAEAEAVTSHIAEAGDAPVARAIPEVILPQVGMRQSSSREAFRAPLQHASGA